MDRLSGEGYNTDKGPLYLDYYESFFAPHRHRAVNLLELGIHQGGSLKMWRDYFEYGQIFGVDIQPAPIEATPRIHTFVGDVSTPDVFTEIESATGVGTFDIIIDDASHIGANVRSTFEHLFVNRLSPGGLYVIEDWGTGYMKAWPDGAAYHANGDVDGNRFLSHDAGVVGYVKALVDHVARADVTAGGGAVPNAFAIDFMTVAPGLVFLKKSASG